MQIVKLVFSDSLKCALSHDIRHHLKFGRRHVENLIRKNDVLLDFRVKTGSSNLLRKKSVDFHVIVF